MEAADVIIQVLDARDPLGFRCAEVERFVRAKDPNKRIVLLLNKIGMADDTHAVKVAVDTIKQSHIFAICLVLLPTC